MGSLPRVDGDYLMAETEKRVLAVIAKMLGELSARRALANLGPGASLERELGLDSLARAELIARLNRELGIQLPDSAMTEAATPAALARMVDAAPVVGAPARTTESREVHHQVRIAEGAATLVDVLLARGTEDANVDLLVMREADGSERQLTYGGLLREALKVTAGLRARKVGRGDAVALMLPPGEGFFTAYIGALMAGAVPVPMYPPFRADRIEEYARRQAAVLRNSEARVMVTFGAVRTVARALAGGAPSLEHVLTGEAFAGEEPAEPVKPNPGDPALLQYTSGSTGIPKGVVLTHANLMANIRALGTAGGFSPRDTGVSWLPLYHDMGLIGAWLGTMYYGIRMVLMSPLTFLARPERWLWAVHAHRATLTGAPNFAFELCARRVPDSALEGLDLSCLRVMFSGAEPVNPETIERFSARFVKYGFNPASLCPVYGMAENSLCLTCPPLGRPPLVDSVSREAFQSEGRAVPAPPAERAPMRFVSCGKVVEGHALRIADDEGRTVAGERMVGRILFRGPSATAGYFRNPEATAELIKDGWHDSGDLGYLAGGEVYVTGRRKDLIIRGGRNFAPQELEEVAGEVEGVRKGCVAAFGIRDEAAGTEAIVVVAETRETGAAERERIAGAIRSALAAAVGVPPDEVVLAAPGVVLKTSSGKIRRSDIRQAFLDGKLGARIRPAWLQAAGLVARSLAGSAFRAAVTALRPVYALWTGVVLLATGAPFWLAVVLPPSGIMTPSRVRRLYGLWSRVTLFLLGARLRVRGRDNAAGGPFIIIPNHTSYADTLILSAALGGDAVIAGKKDLLDNVLIGPVMRKAGHLAVDRSGPGRTGMPAEYARTLAAGTSVLVFPEATMTSATGLRPFTLGAFTAAVEARARLLPVAMSGSRRFLRDETLVPRPGVIEITVGEPLVPAGEGWAEAVRLRDLAREWIGRNCGEPLLDLTETGFMGNQ